MPGLREVKKKHPDSCSLKDQLLMSQRAAKLNLVASKEELRDLKVALRQADKLLLPPAQEEEGEGAGRQDAFKVGGRGRVLG